MPPLIGEWLYDVTIPRLFKEAIFKMAMSLANIIRKGKVSVIIFISLYYFASLLMFTCT